MVIKGFVEKTGGFGVILKPCYRKLFVIILSALSRAQLLVYRRNPNQLCKWLDIFYGLSAYNLCPKKYFLESEDNVPEMCPS